MLGLDAGNKSFYWLLPLPCLWFPKSIKACRRISPAGFCFRQRSVYHGLGAANAHHGAGKLFPGIAAADAVCREAHRALERLEGRFGIVAENAVQRAGRVPKRILSDILSTTNRKTAKTSDFHKLPSVRLLLWSPLLMLKRENCRKWADNICTVCREF